MGIKNNINTAVYPQGYDGVIKILFIEEVVLNNGDKLIIEPKDGYAQTYDIYVLRKEEDAKEGKDVSR